MIKKTVLSANLLACLVGFSSANAADVCLDLSGNSGQVTFSDCTGVWSTLKSSGKFPLIFSTSTPQLYPGLCFVSGNGGIQAKLGKMDITATTTSAWTTEFSPYLPPVLNGPDNIATVITKWSIKSNIGNLFLGNIYTVDAVDTGALNPNSAQLATDSKVDLSEIDVVISGTNLLSGAKGTVRVNSYLDLTTNQVTVTGITGKLCFHH